MKIAIIGAGYRGKQFLRLLQAFPQIEITAVADPNIENDSLPGIACYNAGENDFLHMLDEHRPELVLITSPWQFHITHALRCVEKKCHVALEVKGGLELGEYHPLIDLAKKNGCKVFPLENMLFRQDIQAIYNMVDKGIFGQIIYMRGGYRHDLRQILLDDQGKIGNRDKTESIWRSKFYQCENADLYPTHGLAPLCMIAGINKNDRFASLFSFASKSAGLMQRIEDLKGDTTVNITLGDIISTQIKTEKGILISLIHDTTLPRPRGFDFEIQGTKAIWQGDSHRIYIEGTSPVEIWESDAAYIKQYESPYWEQWGKDAIAIDSHHQGMDYIMLKALEADLQGDTTYPATLEDLALWTSVSLWSKSSIAGKCIIQL